MIKKVLNKQHTKIDEIDYHQENRYSKDHLKCRYLLFKISSSISGSNNSNQECSTELRNLLGFNGFTFNCMVAKKIAAMAICDDVY